jgi:cytochrome c oxidase subunit II
MRVRTLSWLMISACGGSPAPKPVEPPPPPATTEAPRPEPARDAIADGRAVYEHLGCNACHTIDGTARVGPSWKGIWGTEVGLADGRTSVVDAAYVRRSVLTPQADVVQGFPPVMPTFAGNITDAQIAGVVAFIQSLK